MPPEADSEYAGHTLRADEAAALRDLAVAVKATGHLQTMEYIPRAFEAGFGDPGGRQKSALGFISEEDSVFALALRYCNLAQLPATLGGLTRLNQLDLTGNQLADLPESVGGLLALQSLYLDENRAATFPSSIEKLVSLRELHLDKNQLVSLPATLGKFKKLER